MQERAGWGNIDAFQPVLFNDGLNVVDDGIEIGAPDIAAVNHTERQMLIGACFRYNVVKLICAAYQIDVKTCDRQSQCSVEIVAQLTEIGRKQDFCVGSCGKTLVSKFKCSLFIWDEIESQRWFVNLHPVGTGICKFTQQLFINRQQLWQQGYRIEAFSGGFSQLQECNRAKNNWTCVDTQCLGFEEVFHRLAGDKPELLIIAEFWHHVVIIGVEPLGHFKRSHTMTMCVPILTPMFLIATTAIVACFAFAATRHGEIGLERYVAARPAVTGRDGADHYSCIEHMIVKGEVVGWNFRDAVIALFGPIGCAQSAGNREQFCFRRFTRPESFECKFQFAMTADARHTKGGGSDGGL